MTDNACLRRREPDARRTVSRATVNARIRLTIFSTRRAASSWQACARHKLSFIQSGRDSSGHQPMELAVRGDLNAASKSSVEAAMRLPILRSLILGLVLAATPASLSGGFLSPSHDYIVLAGSDVLACDPPRSLPNEAADSYSRVSVETGAARLWRTEIYDLTDCLRMKAEAI